MNPSQMNKRSNHSVIASLSLISLLDLTACGSSSEGDTNTRDGGTGGSKGIVAVAPTGGSGGTNALSSTVTNGTTFFSSEPGCFCPPSSSHCAGGIAIIEVPLNAVNEGVPGYQYCFPTPAALVTNPSYTCWNCADAG
jgi:hypothetical protein